MATVTGLTADRMLGIEAQMKTAIAKYGNLLTNNQASVETDLTGLSSSTGIIERVTGTAYHGVASVKMTSAAASQSLIIGGNGTSGIPVVPTQIYTFQYYILAGSAPCSAACYVNLYDSSGALLTTINSSSITTKLGGWSKATYTFVVPATAAYARPYVYLGTTAGNVQYVDAIGFWAGAGGTWALSGLPIANLGYQINHPNTDDVSIQNWDPILSRWQSTRYHSSLREVSGTVLDANWLGSSDTQCILQRVDYNVTLLLTLNMANIPVSATSVIPIPLGFRSSGFNYPTVNCYVPLSSGQPAYAYFASNNLVLTKGGQTGANTRIRFDWTTSATLPTTLPGTLLSAAPV